jgi:hypothetical protein
MDKEQLAAKLVGIYERLINVGLTRLKQEDVQALIDYYGEGPGGIPYSVLKGRTATIEEWFLETWESNSTDDKTTG